MAETATVTAGDVTLTAAQAEDGSVTLTASSPDWQQARELTVSKADAAQFFCAALRVAFGG